MIARFGFLVREMDIATARPNPIAPATPATMGTVEEDSEADDREDT